MDNNIRTLEKDLRAFAKRNKNVTYTKGLLMTFLITGTISLSAWGAISSADYANYNAGYAVSAISTGQIYGGPAVNPAGNGLGAVYINLAETQNSDGNATAAEKTLNIVGQASKFGDTQLIGQTASSVSKEIEGVRKNIDTSISSIKTDFKTFKAENNRLLKASNLELIQLMEQGDHVVKSPWSSWQYGVNFFYGDYRGAYKGRGDKAEKYPYEGVFTRSEDVFERNTSPLSNSYSKLNTGSDPYSALSSQRKGLSAGYGIGSVKREQEPLVSAKAEVAIIPRIITKNPINVVTPAMTEPNPTTPNIAIKQPKSISVVTPTSPAVNPELPTPNASPFANYCFTGCGNYVTRNMSKNSSGQYVSPDPDYIGRGESLWAGVDINGNPVDGAGSTIATSQETNIGTYTYDSFPKTVGNRKINRPGIVVYLNDSGYVLNNNGYHFENVKLFLKGSETAEIGTAVVNTGSGTYDAGKRVKGQIGLHTVANGTLKDITANLYGKAAFHSIETWHAGKNTYNNVNVNLKGEDNSVFLIYPALYDTLLMHTSKVTNAATPSNLSGTYNKRGEFIGNVNVTVPSDATKNIIYNILGAQGSFEIKSSGDYILEGRGNMVYSGYGYSPNYGKLHGESYSTTYDTRTYYTKIGKPSTRDTAGATAAEMVPSINLEKHVQSYGDDNIVLYFANKNTGVANDPYSDPNLREDTGAKSYDSQLAKWKESQVGIYQGEILVNAVIGNQLNVANSGSQAGGNKTGGDKKYVETNVGVFARSGQRSGMKPTDDFGAISIYDKDPVHSLQINNVDIQFGKHSKSGIMFASEYGTVIDVAETGNNHDVIAIMRGIIKDSGSLGGATSAGEISATDSANKAATGTIIAYSNGVWDNTKHNMSSTTANALNGLPSEINIGKDVQMSARYLLTSGTLGTASETGVNPIVYLAKDGGIVNAKGKTDAKGFYSIIGYADGVNANGKISKVDITGDVTAKDEWAAADAATVPYLYRNIGGFAKAGGLVNMAGAVEVNGIGGLATGSGSIVNLNAANNVIKTGRNGGLAAFSGGTVNFGGGKLINKDVENFAGTSVIEEGSHDSTTPFYAAAGSKIDFQNHTTIEMHNGLIVPEINRALYHTTADPSTANADNRYFNMQNVEYDIKTDKVTLGVFRDRTVASGNEVIWNGSSQDLASGLGFNGIINYAASNPNPFVKTVFENADITIDTTSTVPGSNNTNAAINLTASPHTSETFNALSMERSRVTIAATQTINSTGPLASGVQGLSMGSNTSAASNAETAYYNYGTVSNTGGTPAANIAGINVSYGTIENKSGGNVTVNEGAGIYGTNGSKLVNEAGGTITVTTSGAGIAAKVSADPSNLLGYGTDTNSLASSTQNAIEITNEGDIVTAGMANPIGIFAQNNRADSVHRSRVVVNNRNTLTLGDNGVGIIVTAEPAAAGGNPVHGGTVNLRGTGASDIVTGVNGTGVYAQNSDINLLTDYRVETKDDGAGIFVKGTQSSVNGPGKFVYKYNGSATGKGAGLAFGGSLLGETGTVDAKNYVDVDVENTAGTIGGIASIYTTGGGKFTNYGTVNASTVKGYNIIGDGKDEIINEGVLNVAASASTTEPNIGMVVTGSGKAVNNRTITAGDKSVGIYGFDAELGSASVTSIGKEGIGIYSKGGDVSLSVGSTLNVGTDEGVGVYSVGTGQNVYTAGTINLADNSFGFVNAGTGNKVISDSNVALGNKNIYIYSSDAAGQIHNRGNLTGSGNKNYGVYAAGYSENTGNIDLRNGIGNIGMYSKAGDSHNNGGTITVGASGANPEYNPVDALTGTLKDPSKPFDPVSTLYSVGMAAGYLERDPVTNLLKKDSAGNHIVHDQGKITNSGTIEVSGKDSTGMYGAGANTVVTNEAGASINLAADGAIGIFAEEGAKVINKGTIQTTVDGLKDVKGIVLGKNSTLDNQGGKIIIRNADTSVGVLLKGATIINRGTIEVSGGIGSADVQLFTQNSTGKPVSAFPNSIEIDAAPNVTDATITVNGQIVQPEAVKFNIISSPKNVNISSIGIYVDTSGTEYTIPVIGLQNLTKEADLIIGAEAARRTTAKEIVVDDPNIIEPYNESMRSNGKVETWNFYSGSLTWAATATVRDASSSAYPGHVQINKMYLVKKPYTDWAGNEATPINSTDTYNFLDGLEQRYGVEGVGTREKELFDKISGIGNNEEILFFQAVDEMMGHQYGNVQQRINATGNALDKEFGHLKKDWRNPSKQNNKIKVFGMRDEYKTDTAGIIDYTSNTYGVAYVHEDETVKLGNSSGWYAGTVHNRFDFKDIGKSEENQTMIKAGVFKTMSPLKDHNGALRWTIAGDVFAGINEMKRRYLVVDDIFYADSDYYSYGAALKTDLGYDVRLSERTHLRPYGSFKMEYGRFKDIKEKNGEIRLEVDGNDYYSIKPEVGVEFRYVQPMAVKTNLSVGLSAAYETELGKVGDVNNRGRVRFTEADWFGIRGEKEDRRGNGKFDLNIGVDNTRFGVTVNAGYDTKGENIRGGLGFRAIY